jgi:colicin import membrane protein
MGKDSLIKSTTKKTAKKSAPKKKTAQTKTGSQAKKSTAKKSTASRAQGTRRKATSAAKSAPKKLLLKQFVSRTSPSPLPPPDYSSMTAPPLIDSGDAAEVERLRKLLSRQFDMADIKAAAKAVTEAVATAPETTSSSAPVAAPETHAASPAPLEAPEKLLFRQFVSRTSPSPLPPPDYSSMTAPPLIDSEDAAEVERLRKLLSRQFDMADIKAAAEAVTEIAAPAPGTTSSSAPVEAPETDAAAPPPPEAGTQAQAPETATEQPQAPPASPAPSQAEPIEVAQEQAQEPESEAEPLTSAPPEAGTQAQAPETATEQPQALPASPAPSQAEPIEVAQEQTPKQAAVTEQVAQARLLSQSESPASNHPETGRPDSDPVQRAVKLGLAALALVVLLVVWASISNSSKYFIVPANGSVEIWRGDFSPTGKRFVVVLHDMRLDTPVKSVYRSDEIYPIIFDYYLNKADSFLDVQGLPDYHSITDYLQRADRFALNKEMHHAVDVRRSHIQRSSLLYKADVEAGKGTQESFQSALQSLMDAKRLTKDPTQLQLIDQRIAQVRKSIATLKNEPETPKSGPEAPAGPGEAK